MSFRVQQFLLIFLTHAFSSIFYTDYDFITLYSSINQNFGIIIAELDRIAEKITQDSLHHIHIGMYLNLSVHREVHLYILHTGYQIENFDNRSNIPHNIKVLINDIQLAYLAFSPFQQIIQQRENILRTLIGHAQHIKHFLTDLFGRKTEYQHIEHHLNGSHG